MRKVLILLTAPALVAAFPAAAQQQSNYAQNSVAPADRSGSSSSSSQTRTQDQDQERRICVNAQLSGSHVTRRICRTAREWEAQGGLEADD